MLSHNYVVMT